MQRKNLFFFIEPSLGIAGGAFCTEMPNGFKEKDDKWPKYTPEPGLHFEVKL